MKDIGINSEKEALDFWINGFGESVAYTSFDQLKDVDDKLNGLRDEYKELNFEIQSRDVSKMAEFKINRAIELHFLIEAGDKYFNECGNKLEKYQEEFEPAYEFDSEYDPYKEDGLFPSKYE